MSDPWTPAVHDASHGLAAWATGNRCTGLEVYAGPRKSWFGSFTTGMTHTLLRRHPLAGELRLVGGTYGGKVDIEQAEEELAGTDIAFDHAWWWAVTIVGHHRLAILTVAQALRARARLVPDAASQHWHSIGLNRGGQGEDDAAALNPAFLDRRAGNDGTQLRMAVF
jgi:hypothetical protein